MGVVIVEQKQNAIRRRVRTARAYYRRPAAMPFADDSFMQDAIGFNISQGVENCIDLANHVVKERKLGIPKESRESFDLLAKAGIIPADMAKKLVGMVGFRNVLIHEYQRLDIAVMVDVIEHRLDDLVAFSTMILRNA
jgi:uncharacterized protein YutE (UPF0331/DUF86 family)